MGLICEKAGFGPDPYFKYTFALWIVLIPSLPHAPAIGLGLFLVFVGMQVVKPNRGAVEEFISTFFCSAYASVGLLMLILIRQSGTTEQLGFGLVVMLMMMVWGNDVFAYFGGKSFGKRLLAPKISPKKTWEGFLFGIIGAAAGGAIVFIWIPVALPFSFFNALPLVLLISIFGPLGDLAISKLKRSANLKNASDILPGHGGFLDRFDALILAAPVCYLYLYMLGKMGYIIF